jgi:hypothetical protein
MEIVTMKRAIITAFAAVGLCSIAGVSFAETELSGAQLDDVTAAGGAYKRASNLTYQNNSSKQYQKAKFALVQAQNSNQSNQNQNGHRNNQQSGQGGLIGVGGIQAANGNNVTVLKYPAKSPMYVK